ncbi:MAG: GNAT family N-acetyltransferase [Candidatus Lokiarchaeota archaeon]|nr:GNAT family N-acetyltransferase [Candidatus Lokiarchaeota archaeon]
MDKNVIDLLKTKLENSKEVKVRKYSNYDYEDVKNLMIELAKIYKTKFNEEIWLKAIKKRQFQNQKLTIVAELNKKVVGVCFLDFHWNDLGLLIGTIKHLTVNEAYRDKGIATKIMMYIFNVIQEMEVHKIRVNIAQATEKLDKYFKMFGFKPIYHALERDLKEIKFPFS